MSFSTSLGQCGVFGTRTAARHAPEKPPVRRMKAAAWRSTTATGFSVSPDTVAWGAGATLGRSQFSEEAMACMSG